jgi:protein-disulfide isomerase
MQVDDTTKTYDVTDVTALEFTAPGPMPAANPQPAVEGLAGSSVRAIIYEDLQCPDCAAFRRMLDEKLLPKYAAKVAFVHRDFPLAKHVWARRAAIAARFFAERSPDLGLKYRHYMMAGQEVTTDTNFNQRLTAFAQEHGIAPDTAVAALSNAHYAEVVEQDYQDGVSRGVVHTPTVFVNGKPFIETFTVEEISKAIDEALADAH